MGKKILGGADFRNGEYDDGRDQGDAETAGIA